MEPTWVSGDVSLYLGNNLDILPYLAGVKIVLTDPPYGLDLGARSGSGRSKAAMALDKYDVVGDDKPFDPSPWLSFPKVILWGANHYASRLPDTRCWLAWDKREGGTSDDQADCELAWTNLPGPARLCHHRWRGMIKASEKNEKRIHPTQKPVFLMSWCLEIAKDGDIVLDPYMGSGSTIIAAIKAGRKAIGIEIVSKHFEDAKERIIKVQQQMRLF